MQNIYILFIVLTFSTIVLKAEIDNKHKIDEALQNSALQFKDKKFKYDSCITVIDENQKSINKIEFKYDENGNIIYFGNTKKSHDSLKWDTLDYYRNIYDSKNQKLLIESKKYNSTIKKLKGEDYEIYEYDANGIIISGEEFRWDNIQSVWVKNLKKYYEFNENGELTSLITTIWDNKKQVYINGNKYSKIFDKNNNLISDDFFLFDKINNIWIYNRKKTQVFDENNNLILLENLVYNDKSKYLEGYKTEFTYNNKNKLLKSISYIRNPYKKIWTFGEIKEYIYDDNENVIADILTKYNSLEEKFENYIKVERTYNKQNKLILEIDNLYNKEINEWVNRSKTEFEYDINDSLITEAIYAKDSITNNWYGLSKYSKKYKEGFVIEYIDFNWSNIINEWVYFRKYENEFLNNNNIIYLLYHGNYFWDYNNNNWIGIDKEELLYDDSLNLIYMANFEWDYNNNNWFGINKTENKYDNLNNNIEKVGFTWDLVTNKWITFEKKEVTYDIMNNLIAVKDFEWDNANSKWISRSITNNIFDKNNNLIKSQIVSLNNEEIGYGYQYSYKYNLDIKNEEIHNFYTDYYSKNPNMKLCDTIYNWDQNIKDWKIVQIKTYYYSPIIETSVENEIALNPNILIFPNPSSDKISLDLGGVELADLVVYDILGNEIMSIPNYTNKSEIDISNLSIGTYTLQIQTSTGSISQRLLVNR